MRSPQPQIPSAAVRVLESRPRDDRECWVMPYADTKLFASRVLGLWGGPVLRHRGIPELEAVRVEIRPQGWDGEEFGDALVDVYFALPAEGAVV